VAALKLEISVRDISEFLFWQTAKLKFRLRDSFVIQYQAKFRCDMDLIFYTFLVILDRGSSKSGDLNSRKMIADQDGSVGIRNLCVRDICLCLSSTDIFLPRK
jgi:hypothetical protein